MKKLLVVGGSGALGRSVINTFKIHSPTWKIMNIDFINNKEADENYNLPKENSFKKEEISKIDKSEFLKQKVDCIVNTAGGWTGGAIENEDILESVNQMIQMNLYSSVLSAHLAKKFLNENSLFVLTGANSVYKQLNPGMLGYHLSKQSLHHFAELLNKTNQLSKNSKIITILPDTIDTEANRKAMPTADFSTWTSPEKIGKLIKNWADTKKYPSEDYIKV